MLPLPSCSVVESMLGMRAFGRTGTPSAKKGLQLASEARWGFTADAARFWARAKALRCFVARRESEAQSSRLIASEMDATGGWRPSSRATIYRPTSVIREGSCMARTVVLRSHLTAPFHSSLYSIVDGSSPDESDKQPEGSWRNASLTQILSSRPATSSLGTFQHLRFYRGVSSQSRAAVRRSDGESRSGRTSSLVRSPRSLMTRSDARTLASVVCNARGCLLAMDRVRVMGEEGDKTGFAVRLAARNQCPSSSISAVQYTSSWSGAMSF